MHKLVYVCWEGRGYEEDSWRKDQDVVRSIIDPNKPVFTYGFDVGMIFTNAEPAMLEKEPVEWNETRHGQNDARTGSNIFEAYAAPYKGDEKDEEEHASSVEFAQEEIKTEYWEKHDSFEAWRQYALKNEFIPC